MMVFNPSRSKFCRKQAYSSNQAPADGQRKLSHLAG